MQIIRHRAIVEDDTVTLTDDAPVPAGARIIVPLARWEREADALLAQASAVGIDLPSDKLPKDIPRLHELALIAIEFPRFSDGRGYSIAKLLREREKYQGELRAIGWVLRDYLLFMERVGFTSYQLAPGKSLESAVEAFAELPIAYQATVPDPRPIYRRR